MLFASTYESETYIQLTKLSNYTSRPLLMDQALRNGIHDLERRQIKVRGERALVKGASFAIFFIEDILVAFAKSGWLTVSKELIECAELIDVANCKLALACVCCFGGRTIPADATTK